VIDPHRATPRQELVVREIGAEQRGASAGVLIREVLVDHYSIPLPVALSDSTHGTIKSFELITARVRDAEGVEGVGYTYTVNLPVTSHGAHDLTVHLLAAAPNRSYLEAHGFGLDRFVAEPLRIEAGLAVAPDRPGHGIEFHWKALETVRVR
jgi:L-alanine-DL-glutamate epimerase-like enolase superfamily enzyme